MTKSQIKIITKFLQWTICKTVLNKAVIIHLATNNITTDDSPKTIASKLAEVEKKINEMGNNKISAYPATNFLKALN